MTTSRNTLPSSRRHLPRFESLLAGCACSVALVAAGPAHDGTRSLAGRYDQEFPSGTFAGQKYTVEDLIEIVPVAPKAAYFRIHRASSTGAICGIHGVATSVNEALVYRDRQQLEGSCTLTIERKGRALEIDDHGASCKNYCGMGNSLSEVQIPYASKRPIRYLDRLKASPQYQQALAQWRKESE